MIECPNCGKKNSEDNKFCGECGLKLPDPEIYCPKCDKKYLTGEKFCTKCGQKLVNKLEYEKIKMDYEIARLAEERLILEKKFDYLLDNNLDDLCRIFSIGKMGKTYVKNYLKSNYSINEVIEKFERYKY